MQQKILIIGLGSIGTRHCKNLLTLGYTNITAVTSKLVLPDFFASVKIATHLETILKEQQFTHCFICSPTSLHLPHLNAVLDSGIKHIYLEKPISHNWIGLEEVQNKIERLSAEVYVGYDLRFDEGIQKVKALLQSPEIGQPISVITHVGQYLPDWRPYEDYTKGMSAKVETGGGVLLDLVHEFDYLTWWLGHCQSVGGIVHHHPALKIETEDTAQVLLNFSNQVSAMVQLDYWQPSLSRFSIITCTKSSIHLNLAKQSILVQYHLEKRMEEWRYNQKRDERFQKIISAFMQGETSSLASFVQGMESLKIALAAKLAAQKNVFVHCDELNSI